MLSLIQKYPEHNIRAIYGSSGHKDIYGCLQSLKDFAYRIHFVEAKHHRVKKLNEILESAEQIKFEMVVTKEDPIFEEVVGEGDIAQTIEYALKESAKAQRPEVVAILGSFYLMSEARQYLEYNDDVDPIN